MARSTDALCFVLLTLFLSIRLSKSADPPSPADAPGSPNSPLLPPSSGISSPPAPPPDASGPSPAFPPLSPTSSPAADTPPFLPPAADDSSLEKKLNPNTSVGGGMSTGTKAGVAFGVIGFVALAVVGGIVYKKRKDNMERGQYGSAARRDISI